MTWMAIELPTISNRQSIIKSMLQCAELKENNKKQPSTQYEKFMWTWLL